MEDQQDNTANQPQNVASQPEVIESLESSVLNQSSVFKSSEISQAPKLREFLNTQISNPFNKYCLDCKKNQTTHCLTWIGVFVCQECAQTHRELFPSNHTHYIKDVFTEQWDDYMLRSVTFGGNKEFFEILKEYGIDNYSI